jgi:L,D-transpeptidase YcbB
MSRNRVLFGLLATAMFALPTEGFAAKKGKHYPAPAPTVITPQTVAQGIAMQTADPELPPVRPRSADMPAPDAQEAPDAEMPEAILPEWEVTEAQSLLAVIERVGQRGLIAKDYDPEGLRQAIAGGQGAALNEMATRQFTRLALDLRDGRTPAAARVQWKVKDTDAQTLPIDVALGSALASGDVDGALTALEPIHPDYIKLKAALATTPSTNTARVKLIRANMDRWRWMPQNLGLKHMLANVPEYMLRVVVNNKNIADYPVIVGKKTTQTPSLSANAGGVVVHPPWYLPQSIIKESVGALIATNPAAARAKGYVWTGSGKTLSVIQKAGPNSALGYIKIDMPNPDAIFVHDTPSRHLFGGANKTLSHGCLRTERAMELGILLGMLQKGGTAEELAALIKRGKTERVPFKEPLPVYISYFTMATGKSGGLEVYQDVYSRDAAVFSAFDKPRVERVVAR